MTAIVLDNKEVWIKFDVLEKFMQDVFCKVGVPKEDAKTCARVLITADKFGIDSHGINRLKPMYYDRIKKGIQKAVTNFEIVKEAPATAVVDGHTGMGMVVGEKAMELAIKKAKKFGIGMVVARNSTHYGIAGYYCLMAAKEGMIGICGTNTRSGVAPTFGVENLLGTNPLSFAFPTDEDFPFLLDCATSITQRGKIEIYARNKKPLPKGLVINHLGEDVTNADTALKGLLDGSASMLALGGRGEELGGHKGYGYSTVVEVLSTALSCAAALRASTGVNVGHFFIAVDISAFTETEEFKKRTGNILRTLRNSKKAKGKERIFTAGEKEYLTSIERKEKGAPINEDLRKEIIFIRDALGLTGYDF